MTAFLNSLRSGFLPCYLTEGTFSHFQKQLCSLSVLLLPPLPPARPSEPASSFCDALLVLWLIADWQLFLFSLQQALLTHPPGLIIPAIEAPALLRHPTKPVSYLPAPLTPASHSCLKYSQIPHVKPPCLLKKTSFTEHKLSLNLKSMLHPSPRPRNWVKLILFFLCLKNENIILAFEFTPPFGFNNFSICILGPMPFLTVSLLVSKSWNHKAVK